MARIVTCPHCAASHRIVSAQTQITCDYCRSVVLVARDAAVHELVVPAAPDRQLAYEAALRWLQNEGVQLEHLEVRAARFCPVWALSGQSGEEHHVAARDDAPALLRSLRLPAMPLIARTEDAARSFEPLPEPTVPREQAEAAALGAFRDAAPAVETVRLLWLPVVEISARTPAGMVEGVYVAGADRLLLAPLPLGATDPPIDRPRLILYASFLALTWTAGALLQAPWSRAWIEAALAGVLLVMLYVTRLPGRSR